MSEYPSAEIVEQYCDDILNGRIPACTFVRQAVRRHVADLAASASDLYFDKNAAQLVISFFALLKHSKGEWAGQTIELEGWQQFVVWVLFGWRRADGTRRFRTAYVEVARKNGKSTLGAGIGLYLMVADGEPGAEVYTAATKRDQARISHAEATRMVKASQPLRKRITIHRDNLFIDGTASLFKPLGADSDTMDGLNVHGAIVDEVHAHKSRGTWDALDTATGSRRQPLLFGITTAGFNRQSICWELHQYTEQVLSGAIRDDSWFGIIFTLDRDDDGEIDDWDDESNWIKANPNLGVSKKWDDMRRKARKAREMPSALNVFLRKELDVWTQAAVRWVNRDHWNQCGQAVDADGLRGRTCYGGLDLSSKIDVTAWVLVFPPQVEGGLYQVLCRFFIPEDAMRARSRRDRVPYEAWVREGYMQSTPGNVVDYEWIVAQIDEDMQRYDIREVAFDRWGASRIQTTLMDMGGDDFLVQFGQGYRSMSPPMKELEKLILGHQIAHGNNPVLTWMADNLVSRQDPAGNIKPDKQKSTEKIDGMVALIMALDRAIRHQSKKSVYDERGIRTL